VNWSSSNPAAAMINASGVAKGVAHGWELTRMAARRT
jgi:hypothetical protein